MKKLLFIMLFVMFLSACASSDSKAIREALENRDYTCTSRVCTRESTFTYLGTYTFTQETEIQTRKQEVTQTTIYPTLAENYRLIEVYTFHYDYNSNAMTKVEFELYHLSSEGKVQYAEGTLNDGTFDYEVLDSSLSNTHFNPIRLTNRLNDMTDDIINRWESNFNEWLNR